MDAKYANLAGIKLSLTQEEDCCGRVNESEQYLTIETADGGGGAYLVLTTDRLAIDSDEDIDKFAARLKEILRSMPSPAR